MPGYFSAETNCVEQAHVEKVALRTAEYGQRSDLENAGGSTTRCSGPDGLGNSIEGRIIDLLSLGLQHQDVPMLQMVRDV